MSEQQFFIFNLLRRKRIRQQDNLALQTKRKRMKETQECLLNTVVTMMCFVLSHEYTYCNSIPAPLIPDIRFDPANLGTELTGGLQSEHLFRFTSEQLYYLVDALRMPAWMYTPERDKYNAIEGVCIVLRRLVFPIRYLDMVSLFGRSRASMSRIHVHAMAWLYARWSHLNNFNAAKVIDYQRGGRVNFYKNFQHTHVLH